MTNRLVGYLTAATALAALSLLVSVPVASQNGAPATSQAKRNIGKPDSAKEAAKPSPKKPCIGCSVDGKTTPRTRDGHPDLSGYWINPRNDLTKRAADGSLLYDFGGGQYAKKLPDGYTFNGLVLRPTQPKYKAEYAARVKAIVDGTYGPSTPEDPQYDCKSMGVPRSHVPPFQFFQTPEALAILYESSANIGQTFRVIYTDGRSHPKPDDLETSFLGHSIGHWEGDTLVVDVVGLNDETWLGGGQATEKFALIHSDQEHVIERYTRNGDLLKYEATVEDPVMFTEPWVISPRLVMHGGPDDDIVENYCNARDKEHIIRPSQKDSYQCNYCVPGKETKTPPLPPQLK